ncbi:hypothetical protein [Salinispora tropica]|uniref:Uncharacterized protein n=1 Tax=Salinispora tropica (strain ATCC BAA-916 / DSM 44818 / JCM 13857 / NBRC 105044 / CNB-440) TaxID=369723 RepID=A4X9B7_SALTO|nr:hypothetical protein [Salinispora tropica]ABP55484.1 hypothetical protein Strop_3047 [Salinispora tropica CNB-440]
MTRRVVLPPLFDLSLEPVLGPGDELFDGNAEFLARLTAPMGLRALAAASAPAGSGVAATEAATKALFAEAAATIMDRGRHDWGRLRAMGLALRLSAEADPAIRLAVDDVELVGGTTESGADVVSAAARTALFAPEADRAHAWASGSRVHLLVETDQQLPAAAGMAVALGPHRVTLCGRFAAAHQKALRALAPFTAAEFEDWTPSWRLRREWAPEGEDIRWVRDAHQWYPGRPWAGWLAPEQAVLLPARAWRECRGVALTVARFSSWSAVTGVSGVDTDLETVRRLVGDDRLAVELLVGAPGLDADVTTTAARRLRSGPGPRLAGLSPFRLTSLRGSRGSTTWGGVPLTRQDSPQHDLPRWDRFHGPASLDDADRQRITSTLTAEFGAETELYPGRLACCALAPGFQPPAMWEPSAAVVEVSGAGPDGRGPGSFVVNLRTGSAFRLHPRLTPVVRRLANGDAAVWQHLSDTVRTKLSGQLVRAGAIRSPQ